jgi:hypothetical protein
LAGAQQWRRLADLRAGRWGSRRVSTHRQMIYTPAPLHVLSLPANQDNKRGIDHFHRGSPADHPTVTAPTAGTRNRRPPEARCSGTSRCRWMGSWRNWLATGWYLRSLRQPRRTASNSSNASIRHKMTRQSRRGRQRRADQAADRAKCKWAKMKADAAAKSDLGESEMCPA